MRNAIAYITTLVVFLALDFVWIGFLARPIYQAEIGELLAKDFKAAPAIVFYLIYIAGVVAFVVTPALRQRQWQSAALMGAAFGLVAYATYDLTNLATLKGFTLKITLVDLAWGAAATSFASTVGYAVARRLG
jgi:uncharacterized membrane protein